MWIRYLNEIFCYVKNYYNNFTHRRLYRLDTGV